MSHMPPISTFLVSGAQPKGKPLNGPGGYFTAYGRCLDWRGWARAIMAIRETPRQVALGVALGAFIAFTPFIGIQMLLAALAASVAGASKKAAMLAVWISNPLTMGPIFALTYHLGLLFITPGSAAAATVGPASASGFPQSTAPVPAMSLGFVMQAGQGLLIPLLVGGAVMGVLAAALSYELTRRGVEAFQTKEPATARAEASPPRPDNI